MKPGVEFDAGTLAQRFRRGQRASAAEKTATAG
jgi:hypothetical protein